MRCFLYLKFRMMFVQAFSSVECSLSPDVTLLNGIPQDWKGACQFDNGMDSRCTPGWWPSPPNTTKITRWCLSLLLHPTVWGVLCCHLVRFLYLAERNRMWESVNKPLHQFNPSFSTMRFNNLALTIVALLFNQIAATPDTYPIVRHCMSQESYWTAC
jgi:hypothetical protein